MNKLLVYISIFFALGMTSCTEYNKVLKSNNIEYKKEMAEKYFQDGEYYKALSLIDELIAVLRGGADAEKYYYYLAKCHYGLNDYFMSSYYLNNFVKTYPNSGYAEECMFLSAYSNYKMSPSTSLDQRDTKYAIDEFQVFLDKYPTSNLKDSCNALIDKMNVKLEAKSFDNASQYYKIEQYKSAIVTLKGHLKKYPGSVHKEETMYLVVKAGYLLAENSIETKMEERYRETIKYYQNFVDLYPQSKHVQELESFYGKALAKLN